MTVTEGPPLRRMNKAGRLPAVGIAVQSRPLMIIKIVAVQVVVYRMMHIVLRVHCTVPFASGLFISLLMQELCQIFRNRYLDIY